MNSNISSILRKLISLNIATLTLVIFLFSGCNKTASTTPVKEDSTQAKTDAPAAVEQKSGVDISKYDMQYNDMAKILGGFEVSASSKFFKLTEEKAWKNHQKFFTSKWANLQKEIMDSVEYWAQTELADLIQKPEQFSIPLAVLISSLRANSSQMQTCIYCRGLNL